MKSIFKEVGVASKLLVMDGARVQVREGTLEQCRLAGFAVVELERGTPWANSTERNIIGQLKTGTKGDMDEAKSPILLWCYCLERRALID